MGGPVGHKTGESQQGRGPLPGGRQHGNRETLSVLQGQKFKGHRGCGSINLAKVAASHVGL